MWYHYDSFAIYDWSLDWRVPIVFSLLYILTATVLNNRSNTSTAPNRANRSSNSTEPCTPTRMFIILHNAILAIVSAFLFVSIVSLVWHNFNSRPSHAGYCDAGALSYNQGVGFLIWLFYISKYVELIDTAILLVKGKCSRTHIFHHTGAILSLWMLTSSRNYGAWIFVWVNSGTHALVYSYFAFATIGYPAPWKAFVTVMQFIHMIVGLPLAVSYLLVPGCFPMEVHPKDQFAKLFNLNGYWSASIATIMTITYTIALVFIDTPRRNATFKFLRIKRKQQ